MLPYTPLHELILEQSHRFPPALIMTSGNRGGEPIEFVNAAAEENLKGIADAFLMHDRDIQIRCDDSVVVDFDRDAYPVRRSRGYAPEPLRLANSSPPLLAVGAELKNTFCLTRDRYAFVSQHLGNLNSLEALQAYEDSIRHFESLFRIRPEAIAADLHPDYLATDYARRRSEADDLPLVAVQHHHAHLAACLLENNRPPASAATGLIFDGTGYGEDGAIWGGEVLLGSAEGYQRALHLGYIPLPGGDSAIRHPWKTALSWLHASGIDWEEDLAPVNFTDTRERDLLLGQIEAGLNCPRTSSMGRLFDAVAAILGVCQSITYEAQGAIELEACLDPEEAGRYTIDIEGGLMDARPLIRALVSDLRAGTSVPRLSARFHNTVAALALEVSALMRTKHGVSTVALSGGVWQNRTLLAHTVRSLERGGFEVLIHRRVPTNDGGISLGQVAVAAATLTRGDALSGDDRNRPTGKLE
jgi:hydrogenase maturation protein HypF